MSVWEVEEGEEIEHRRALAARLPLRALEQAAEAGLPVPSEGSA